MTQPSPILPQVLAKALAQALERAQECLTRRDADGAEQAIIPLARLGLSTHPDVLGAMGAIRMYQGRLHEAVALLTQGRAAAPQNSTLALNLGRALSALGRVADAEAAMREALRLQRGWAEAHFELGHLLHRIGRLAEAEAQFRSALRQMPELTHAKLALGAVLTDQGRPADAEVVLRRALGEAGEPSLVAQINLQLSAALLRQRKDAEALAAADAARALGHEPMRTTLRRAEALQNLGRQDEALAILRDLLTRAPNDPGLHHDYNALLYRLRRDDEFLKSYDRVPASRPLQLGKAHFLAQADRHAEAHDLYATLLAQDASDMVAAMGVARALAQMNRLAEAATAYDALLKRPDIPSGVFAQAAEAALLAGDPERAARLCEDGLRRAPLNGALLANLGTAWRMMDDERDEILAGYDTLVRVFDLEPPEGFSSMDEFNAELNTALDRLHPATREFLGQSLRGGTQTPNDLFGSGITQVGKLMAQIDAAVALYIAELKEDHDHPFLSRRTAGYRYAGSWSSRLMDCGFHVNHIHPKGWISSCYYVAVPPATTLAGARQGWIKFGEPHLNVALKNPVRRAIQPIPGRLVLFPSYLWHGTIPFRDATARTTIAFDVTPAADGR
jgi:tetratricopeptide (TPR) repeat protein